MKKIILLLKFLSLPVVVFCFFVTEAESQTYQDSCIRIIWEHNPEYGYFNPDSVLIDSCMCPDMIWEFCPYLYANRWYKLYLPNGAINLPAYPHDTTIYVSWQDIDTNFVELRQKFSEMESIFGNFIFKKVSPEIIDTFALGSRHFVIKFDDYLLIDSVVQFLKTFPDIENPGYTFHLANYSDVKNSNNIFSEFFIYPNPSYGIINIEFNLEKNCNISFDLFDLKCEKMINIDNAFFIKGHYSRSIELSNEIGNGFYILFVKYDQSILTKEIILIR